MADTWFTSDSHFVYFNIIRYCNRPFASTEEMTGCAPRRVELAALTKEDIQQRVGRWVIADLHGKGGRIRTVAIPMWVKLCRKNGRGFEQIKFLLGHASIQTTERYLGSEQEIAVAVNDNLGL